MPDAGDIESAHCGSLCLSSGTYVPVYCSSENNQPGFTAAFKLLLCSDFMVHRQCDALCPAGSDKGYLASGRWEGKGGSQVNVGVIIFFIMLAVILVFRLPVGIGMLSMGVIYMMITGGNLKIIATGVLNLYYSNYILIAVPLFLFTANVMNSGRITEKIFDFTDGIVGRFRGGLAHVNVLASLIFAGMSGSASADASGLGNMEIAEMRKKDMIRHFPVQLPQLRQP